MLSSCYAFYFEKISVDLPDVMLEWHVKLAISIIKNWYDSHVADIVLAENTHMLSKLLKNCFVFNGNTDGYSGTKISWAMSVQIPIVNYLICIGIRAVLFFAQF